MRESTFVMVKPDGVQRGLIAPILGRFERRGFKLTAAELRQLERSLAEAHYAEHAEKPFFDDLIEFITAGPVFTMVWTGPDVTHQVRRMVGATDPAEAAPGTIRGDYGVDLGRNVIHASDHEDPGANEREIELFFGERPPLSYTRIDEPWLVE
jgi:nucleoside-diphosphate kinase